MRPLTQIFRAHLGLFIYTALNFLDKLLNFGIPLLVLYVFSDRGLYNEIEYIYSLALVATTAVELGVRNYFLYAYRMAAERERLVAETSNCFLLQLCL